MTEASFKAKLALPSILVVDDMPDALSMIAELLGTRYRCRVATNGAKALEIAGASPKPDIILLDVIMPGMDGYEVCRQLKNNPATRDIPVIFLSSMGTEEDETRGFAVGGADYISKPVSRTILIARVGAQLDLLRSRRLLAEKSSMLENMISERSRQLEAMQEVAIIAMASLAEARNGDTSAHVRRVQHYTRALAVAVQQNTVYRQHISDEMIELLFKTSPLHDIGKVGVRDSILFKPGKLSAEEFEEMKRHVFFGGQTLMDVERQLAAPETFLSVAYEIALHHHERWDGTGYPLGLRGEEIPLSARIVALADTYDALNSVRLYKPSYTTQETRDIIAQERGKQLDPVVVDAFLTCEDEFMRIAKEFADPEGESARVRTLQRLMRDREH